MIKKIQRAFTTLNNRKTTPLHIEFNLTDYCNLNCRGCSHYSPLADADFEPLERLEDSMRHISSIKDATKIEGVFLIGGETLLYPQLKEAMRLARHYFPWARISVFTNGLLIPKMDDEFWQCCRDLNIIIALTRYPLKFDYDRVEEICRGNDVEVEVFGDRGMENSFFRLPLDPKKSQIGWLSHFRCIGFSCITIDNGRIFPCSQAACVGHLNKKLGTDFKWEENDFIKVEDLRDARELLRLRNRPIPFCKYCKPIEPVKYGPSRKEAKEWVDQ